MKLSQIIIFTLLSLNLIPPLFADGAIFSTTKMVVNECGKMVEMPGIYFDNVYYPILYFLLSFIALSLPYIDPSLKKVHKDISTMTGAWLFSGFVFELINISTPELILNSQYDSNTNFQYVLAIALGYIFLTLKRKWHQMI